MAGETIFRNKLEDDLMRLYPNAIILRVDPYCIQGFPDRLMLYENTWASFEVKASKDSEHQPNQDYYVDLLNDMSFAKFVYPENKNEVLHELQRALRINRSARLFRR